MDKSNKKNVKITIGGTAIEGFYDAEERIKIDPQLTNVKMDGIIVEDDEKIFGSILLEKPLIMDCEDECLHIQRDQLDMLIEHLTVIRDEKQEW